jgi:hypothetical protein
MTMIMMTMIIVKVEIAIFNFYFTHIYNYVSLKDEDADVVGSCYSYTSTFSWCNFNPKTNPGFVEQHLQLAYFGILCFSKDMSETSFMKR